MTPPDSRFDHELVDQHAVPAQQPQPQAQSGLRDSLDDMHPRPPATHRHLGLGAERRVGVRGH